MIEQLPIFPGMCTLETKSPGCEDQAAQRCSYGEAPVHTPASSHDLFGVPVRHPFASHLGSGSSNPSRVNTANVMQTGDNSSLLSPGQIEDA